ncbi:hypothetical protein GCM10020331_037010 [Ectobacillus funiculus]
MRYQALLLRELTCILIMVMIFLTVEVRDTGAGIDKETQHTMFEKKGFSTKGEDRGLGLFF